MRYSRIQNGDMYITTTAVVLSETLKIIVCLCVLFVNQKCTVRKYMSFLYQSIIVEWKDTLKLSVPALVYMIQNNLQYIAVSNLEAAVFQVRDCYFCLIIYSLAGHISTQNSNNSFFFCVDTQENIDKTSVGFVVDVVCWSSISSSTQDTI